MGSLEYEVLVQLWAMPDGATPAEVLEGLGDDLAYTTVMTILTRLWQKGQVSRERRGRAFVYRPEVSEAELTAHRMRESFAKASDQKQVLSLFVESLSTRDMRTLRNLVENPKRRR